MRSRWFAAALALALAAGCGSGNGKAATTTTATSVGSSSSTSSPATTGSPTTAGSSTSTTSTTSTTAQALQTTVHVFFLDQNAFAAGRQPYVRAVDRVVDAVTPARGALDALFAGPTADEAASGLRFVASGATGYRGLSIEGGTARVQLVGGCSSGGSTFSIADEIFATLHQFATVEGVKIFDPDGGTESPDAPGDSIPFCLEP